MNSYGKRRRKQTKLSSQILFSDDEGGDIDGNNSLTSDSIDSKEVGVLESPKKRVDLYDSLTSSPKKYVKVIDDILASPNSKNIKKRLFEESIVVEEAKEIKIEVKKDNKHEFIPEAIPGKRLKKVSNVWGDLFDNIHKNKPQKAKLASNEVESNVWDSAFEEIEPSQSAVSIELHSDEETNLTDCTSEEIDLELVFEDVQDVVEQVVVRKKRISTGRTYGKVRSFRVAENVDDNDDDEVDEVEDNDESQDINDLRLVSINAHLDEEMELRLDGLDYARHGFRVVFLELTETIDNLQQLNQTYISYGSKILACLPDLPNDNPQEIVINWLVAVVHYYLIVNKVNVPIDLPHIINSLKTNPLDQKVVLSTIARNNLAKIHRNLPKSLLNNLIEAAPPGTTVDFDYLCQIYPTSDLSLQIEILKYFERYLGESKDIGENLTLFLTLIGKLFDNIEANLEENYYIAKLIVVLSTNYPQYMIFTPKQPIIIFQLLNGIYLQKQDQKDVCLFLLGYLVNVVESGVWHQVIPELLQLIDKNIELLTVATGDNIIKHMMGYNSLILSYLKLNKQVVKIESHDLIVQLQQFKGIIGNELIAGTVDKVIGELKKES